MARGKGIAIAVGLMVLMGGKKKASAAIAEPPLEPLDPEQPLGPLIPASWDGPGGEEPIGPVHPVVFGQTVPVVFSQATKPTPTPGFGYQIRSTDNALFGDSGIVARALRKPIAEGGLGRNPTVAERVAYYQATTRVLSNWRLYGTLATGFTNASERVQVVSGTGDSAVGTITAALLPQNDPWAMAVANGVLPSRLIQWTRNPNTGKVRVLQNWQAIAHGPRTYGCILLPRIECMERGAVVTQLPECDWPPELFAAAGHAHRGEWIP